MGKLPTAFLRNFQISRSSDSFLVLDIGTFSVKALRVYQKKDSDIFIEAHSEKKYIGDMRSEGGFDDGIISAACIKCLKEIKKISGRKLPQRLILGLGGGFLYGKTTTHNHIRENPGDELSHGELSNIIQKIQRRIYDQIRKDFSRDTGRSELDVCLVGSYVSQTKIDGHQIVNPLGFIGKEVSVSLFNAYASKDNINVFKKIANNLGLTLDAIVPCGYVVWSSMHKTKFPQTDAILIDMGGSVTEVSMARRGRLEDIKSIPVGGESFTSSLSEAFKFSVAEAENIKRRFAEGALSPSVAKKIEKVMACNIKIFFNSLDVVLSEMSKISLLPSQIFIYGGGAINPIIEKSIKQKRWRENLSFLSNKIYVKKLNFLTGHKTGAKFKKKESGPLWVSAIAMAHWREATINNKDEISLMLKRTVRLIQG